MQPSGISQTGQVIGGHESSATIRNRDIHIHRKPFRISTKYETLFDFAQVNRWRSQNTGKGAQWLSSRVLDSRPTGRGFEPHWRHCVVVHEQDTFILA